MTDDNEFFLFAGNGETGWHLWRSSWIGGSEQAKVNQKEGDDTSMNGYYDSEFLVKDNNNKENEALFKESKNELSPIMNSTYANGS